MPTNDSTATHQSLSNLRQELQQLREEGSTKRRRNQGELLHFQEHHDALHEKWKRTTQKRPLHAYIKAVTSEQHLVPSKILSKQAKLAQSLHFMEVCMQQTNLIEKQQRQYAQLLCTQAAQQEEMASEISLQMMNDLCRMDGELRELREHMRDIGMTASGESDEESDKSSCSSLENDNDDDEIQQNLSSSDKTLPTTNTATTSSQQQPWWWPISHGDEKQKAPGTTTTDNDCSKSVASESSVLSMNPMSLLWMPPKFKQQQQENSPMSNDGSQHTIPSVKSDLSNNEKNKYSLWSSGGGDASVTHNSDDDSENDSSSHGSNSYKPVARQWWPSKVEAAEPQQEQEEQVATPEEQQHWWESFYR